MEKFKSKTEIELEIELDGIEVNQHHYNCYSGIGILNYDLKSGLWSVHGFGQDQDGSDHDLGDISDWFTADEINNLVSEKLNNRMSAL